MDIPTGCQKFLYKSFHECLRNNIFKFVYYFLIFFFSKIIIMNFFNSNFRFSSLGDHPVPIIMRFWKQIMLWWSPSRQLHSSQLKTASFCKTKHLPSNFFTVDSFPSLTFMPLVGTRNPGCKPVKCINSEQLACLWPRRVMQWAEGTSCRCANPGFPSENIPWQQHHPSSH